MNRRRAALALVLVPLAFAGAPYVARALRPLKIGITIPQSLLPSIAAIE